MCHSSEETYDVYDETKRQARKRHACSACKEIIEPKDFYWHVALIFDSEARTIKRCLRCQTIHVHLRSLSDELWPDERLNCGNEYEEMWGRLPPETIAGLAFKTRQEMQRVGNEK